MIIDRPRVDAAELNSGVPLRHPSRSRRRTACVVNGDGSSRLHALSGSAAIAWQTPAAATPGVYAMDRTSRVFTGAFEFMWIFPPRWSRKVSVGDALDGDARNVAAGEDDLVRVGRVRREHADVADLARRLDSDEVDRVEQAPASAIARARSAKLPGRSSRRTRRVRLKEAE